MNGLLQEKAMICFKSIICLLFTVVAMSIYGMEVGPDASAVKSEGCWIEVSCDSLSLTNEGIFVCINGQLLILRKTSENYLITHPTWEYNFFSILGERLWISCSTFIRII